MHVDEVRGRGRGRGRGDGGDGDGGDVEGRGRAPPNTRGSMIGRSHFFFVGRRWNYLIGSAISILRVFFFFPRDFAHPNILDRRRRRLVVIQR